MNNTPNWYQEARRDVAARLKQIEESGPRLTPAELDGYRAALVAKQLSTLAVDLHMFSGTLDADVRRRVTQIQESLARLPIHLPALLPSPPMS